MMMMATLVTSRTNYFRSLLSTSFKYRKVNQLSKYRRSLSSAAENLNRPYSSANKYTWGAVGLCIVGFAGTIYIIKQDNNMNEKVATANVKSLANRSTTGHPVTKTSDLPLESSSHTVNKAGESNQNHPWHLRNLPTKQVRHNKADNTTTLTLYQYGTCPFCCKVRAYLDYYGINYDIIEVDSFQKTQTKWTTYGKVPMLVYTAPSSRGPGGPDYVQLNDSSVIVSVLDSERINESEVAMEKLLLYYPTIESREGRKTVYDSPNKYFIMCENQPVGRELSEIREEREWREWVDDNLVHILSPNAYRTLPEAVQTFRWFSEVGDWKNCMTNWSRLLCIYSGAFAMWGIGGRLKRKYGLQNDVRLSLYESINDWLEGIGTSRKYMGGDKPNLADLAVYGVMSSIEGCEAFQDLSKNTKFMDWYSPMKMSVLEHHGSSHTAKGESANP